MIRLIRLSMRRTLNILTVGNIHSSIFLEIGIKKEVIQLLFKVWYTLDTFCYGVISVSAAEVNLKKSGIAEKNFTSLVLS